VIDLGYGSGYLRCNLPHTKGQPLARKILLADDSVTAQNMGRKILTEAGYEVITVNNGSAALKKIAEQKPDLIILDVYMPGYGGLEVCQRIKDTPEIVRIPVLLTVGKLEPFKPEEAQPVPHVTSTGTALRDLGRGEDITPLEVKSRFQRLIPISLPPDITSEEIAGITAAAAAFENTVAKPSSPEETAAMIQPP